MPDRKYRSNIPKAYAYDFLKNCMLFSGVLVPFFTVWGGITFSQIMILQAVFTTSMFLFEIPTGVIADRFGRKTSLILSSVVTTAAVLVYSSYPSFWVFVCGEILWAVGVALASGADTALVYDSLIQTGDETGSKSILNRVESIGLFAMVIAAPLGSLTAKYIGLDWALRLSAISIFLSAAVGLTFNEPPTQKKSEEKNYFKILQTGLKYFRDHKILRLLTIDYVAIMMLSFFMIWVYQVVLKSLNFPLEYYGFVHAAIVVAEIIVLNSVIKFENVVKSKKKYILYASILVGICYLVLSFSTLIALSIACIVLIGGFGMTMKPLYYSYMNKYIESDNRATVLSAVSMARSIVTAVANIIFGYLVDLNVSYTLFGIGVITITFAIVSRVKEEHLKD